MQNLMAVWKITKQKRVILRDSKSCTCAETHGLPRSKKPQFRLSGVNQQVFSLTYEKLQ